MAPLKSVGQSPKGRKALEKGLMLIKRRDIYYRDPSLFKKQEVVDRYIDDIAFTCKVTRKDLNVVGNQ